VATAAVADSSRHGRLLQHVQTLTAHYIKIDDKVPRSIDDPDLRWKHWKFVKPYLGQLLRRSKPHNLGFTRVKSHSDIKSRDMSWFRDLFYGTWSRSRSWAFNVLNNSRPQKFMNCSNELSCESRLQQPSPSQQLLHERARIHRISLIRNSENRVCSPATKTRCQVHLSTVKLNLSSIWMLSTNLVFLLMMSIIFLPRLSTYVCDLCLPPFS